MIRKTIRSLLLLSFLLLLLLLPETAASGARTGLLLWYSSVIPVLFPFILISSLILQFRLLEQLPPILTAPLRTLFGCSTSGCFAIVAGFLCGFPIGAKLSCDLAESKKISAEEYRFLLRFVNNVSPGFLISYAAADQMQMTQYAFLFPLNILGASFLYGIFSARSFKKRNALRTGNALHASVSAQTSSEQPEFAASGHAFAMIDRCISDSMLTVLKLGGYMILFSVLSETAFLIPGAKEMPLLFLISNIEITNGIAAICDAPSLPPLLRYLLVHAVCAFGGLSAAMQSAGICRMKTAQFLEYIKSRAIITLLSVLLSGCSLYFCQFLF